MSETSQLDWSGSERRLLALLALPSFALALSVTMVSSLLPVLLHSVSDSALPAMLLGLEGVFAIFLPSLLGSFSDRTRTNLGPRIPFVLAAVPIIALALALMPTVGSVVVAAGLLILFYAGYFAYFTPHFALYSDVVPDRLRGRSQAAMNIMRQVGVGIALIGGPALLAAAEWLPFEIAALLVLVVSGFFVDRLLRAGAGGEEPPRSSEAGSPWDRLGESWGLIRRNRQVRLVVTANALWETALNVLRAFVVLYFVVGIGRSAATASLILALVAISVLVASPVSGWLAERIGEVRVMYLAAIVYAAGAWVPGVFHGPWVVAIVPPVAFAAGILMTLPFSLLMGALPDDARGREGQGGASAGVFGISRGLGLMLGPMLGAAMIALSPGLLESSNGYGAVFFVAAAAIAASIPVLRRLARATG